MTDKTDSMNGKELFYATESRFTYWYADSAGIHASLDSRAYQKLSIDEALTVMNELSDIIRYCRQHE